MVEQMDMIAWALSLPEASQSPHFERESFRVRKRIFATLDTQSGIATLKLSEIDQSVFSGYDRGAIYPVPGSWGKKGWTIVDLSRVRKSVFKDALQTAYSTVAPKKYLSAR